MRILLTGSQGQIGGELFNLLSPQYEVISPDKKSLDLSNPDSITAFVRENEPELIINAGAYTAVDLAEEEKELATAINGAAPSILAKEAKKIGAGIIHFSTDYVFDGSKQTPYTEEDQTNPINHYGASKLAGEIGLQKSGAAHIILRTSWIYGKTRNNFFLTMQKLAKERREIKVVDDQTGCPTWCSVPARGAVDIVKALSVNGRIDTDRFREVSGVYNLVCDGAATWYEFAEAIVNYMPEGDRPILTPIASSDFPTPAKRPAYSVLSCAKIEKIFGIKMDKWPDALEELVTGH